MSPDIPLDDREYVIQECFSEAAKLIDERGVENIDSVLVIIAGRYQFDIQLAGRPFRAVISCVEAMAQLIKDRIPELNGIGIADMTLMQIAERCAEELDKDVR